MDPAAPERPSQRPSAGQASPEAPSAANPSAGTPSAEAPSSETGLLFDAVLTPHRSLPPQGFLLLMAAVGLFGFCAGLGFFLAGAWPVVGFMGVEFALLYLAFRINYRRGRAFETLALTRDSLEVRRVDHRGRARSWRFQPYWLRVELLQAGGPDPQIALTSHGQRLVIGGFLAPEERVSLAEALNRALANARGTG